MTSSPTDADFRDLPDDFLAYNRSDPNWLRALPSQIEEFAARWHLVVEPHFPGIRINYVAPATRADGTRCVFKLSRFVDETRNEIAALQLWDGHGVARLLDSDPDRGALLVERLEPGTMLVGLADDDAATIITADILRQLWRPVADDVGLRSLASWCEAYERNRAALSRGDRGFPAALFNRADALRAELLTSTGRWTSLHGDMHHFNVLRSRRAPWLAIDPKGLAGDRAFDVCQYLRNPRPVPIHVNRRRVDIFCAELGLDRAHVRDWCFVHAMLDACWDYEDGGSWESTVRYAEDTLRF